jgi:hypothetical protein
MGFNLRIFNIGMLLSYYKTDKDNGIGNAIGKAEGFIFTDNKSSKIVKHWRKGNKEKAIQLMEKYVSGITT